MRKLGLNVEFIGLKIDYWMGMSNMVVFDGDEFTESLRKMDEEYEKAILEIVKKHLKKTGQEDLFEEYLEERKKRYG